MGKKGGAWANHTGQSDEHLSTGQGLKIGARWPDFVERTSQHIDRGTIRRANIPKIQDVLMRRLEVLIDDFGFVFGFIECHADPADAGDIQITLIADLVFGLSRQYFAQLFRNELLDADDEDVLLAQCLNRLEVKIRDSSLENSRLGPPRSWGFVREGAVSVSF